MEKISLNLSNMKFMLYGDAENEPKEGDMNKLVEEVSGTAAQSSHTGLCMRCTRFGIRLRVHLLMGSAFDLSLVS